MDQQGQLAELWRNWTPPPGLGHGTPRQIRLTGSGIAIVVIVVVMLAGALAVGIALDYLNRRQTQERRMLQLYGADADAVVTRLWRRGNKNRERWIAYQFSVEGRPYQRSRRVSAQRWNNMQVGSPVPIRFLPANPALSYPRGSEPRPMPNWLPYLVGSAMAGAAWLVAWSLQRQRQLLTEGRPAPGIVTRLSRMKGGVKVYYDFLLLSGSVAKGSSGPVSKPPGIGQTVCVLYHPDNPRRNAIYPLCLVKEDRLN